MPAVLGEVLGPINYIRKTGMHLGAATGAKVEEKGGLGVLYNPEIYVYS